MRTRTVIILLAAVAIAGGAVGSTITLVVRGEEDGAGSRGELVHVRPLVAPGELMRTPFCVAVQHFCITEPQEGQFLALYTADPHLREQGCTVHWDGAAQQEVGPNVQSQTTVVGIFIGDCTASRFDISGKRLFGPAPRDLDRFPIASTADGLVVNTKTLICGEVRLDGASGGCTRAPAID